MKKVIFNLRTETFVYMFISREKKHIPDHCQIQTRSQMERGRDSRTLKMSSRLLLFISSFVFCNKYI